jgi:hypothetical protein
LNKPTQADPRHRTDEFAQGAFQPHGLVEVWLDGRNLRYDAVGPFNRELIRAIAKAQHDIMLAAKARGPCVEIVTIRESALVTPDGLAELAAILQDVNHQGLAPLAVAYVMAPDVEGASLMAPVFRKRYQDQGRVFQVFETLEDAQTWALALLETG